MRARSSPMRSRSRSRLTTLAACRMPRRTGETHREGRSDAARRSRQREQHVRAYRERVSQADALGEFAISEEIREILRQDRNIRSISRPLSARTFPTFRS